jgi:hypothetical protein
MLTVPSTSAGTPCAARGQSSSKAAAPLRSPARKPLAPKQGNYHTAGHTRTFKADATHAEPRGYLAATQTPDGVIHLVSSGLHYRFNLPWLTAGMAKTETQHPEEVKP